MKTKRSVPRIMQRAGELRKEPTPAETRLWSRLRRNQLNETAFRRQHAIGPYITDFCAVKAKLVVELDGSQHLEQEAYDMERTAYLKGRGYRVLRFWNNDVMNDLDAVLWEIALAIEEGPLYPPILGKNGGKKTENKSGEMVISRNPGCPVFET